MRAGETLVITKNIVLPVLHALRTAVMLWMSIGDIFPRRSLLTLQQLLTHCIKWTWNFEHLSSRTPAPTVFAYVYDILEGGIAIGLKPSVSGWTISKACKALFTRLVNVGRSFITRLLKNK